MTTFSALGNGRTMKFPITREALQVFDYAKDQEELMEKEVQKSLTQLVDIICNEVQKSMRSLSKEKKYVWRNLHLARHLNIMTSLNHLHIMNTTNVDKYLPRFIEKLQETFIGCDIIMDRLKSYLIIDWS